MFAHKIDTESIRDGLDRKHLTTLKKRFLQINGERLDRTRSALKDRQSIFLDLLPLLFHCNHPMLPGYVSRKVPCGVAGYKPGKTELALARQCARSFRLQAEATSARQIQALFIMGSVGTVAHSEGSDLDVWLCHDGGLDRDALALLEQKAQAVSAWAKQLGLEAHFFLMDARRFREGANSSLSTEASGSTQHFLLLDEFYRSAILLAGRAPLWWFVPRACENDYSAYSEILLDRRYLRANDVIDFGAVATIPAHEFIGAGMWQLYKAIESPYKAVLKLLLLEAYATDYPAVSAVALSLKGAVYDGELNVDELDPYLLMYRRIEFYLLGRGDRERLELARRCFYFKINKALTRGPTGPAKSWQRQLLERLVADWGWSKQHLSYLDSRPRWKASQVVHERKALVNELTTSYRRLLEFSRRLRENGLLNRREFQSEEFTILGRKLYASFERRAGKIDFINSSIAKDLSEPALCFVYQEGEASRDGKKSRAPRWSVYPFRAIDGRALGERVASPRRAGIPDYQESLLQPLKQTRGLVELVLWCYCNGILARSTICDLLANDSSAANVSQSANKQTLEHIVHALRRWCPMPLPPVDHEAFRQPANLSHALLFLNLGQESQAAELHLEAGVEDPFTVALTEQASENKARASLILSIDMVLRNSWNEVETLHFAESGVSKVQGGSSGAGDEPLVQCLLHYLRLVTPSRQGELPHVTVVCHSAAYNNSIKRRLHLLIRDLRHCYFESGLPSSTRYVFAMANRFYCLQFSNDQPRIVALQDEAALWNHLSQPQAERSPFVIDRFAPLSDYLKQLASLSVQAGIQVVYRKLGDEAQIAVVDEQGSLFQCRCPFEDERSLLRPMHRFIRAVLERQQHQRPELQVGFGFYPVSFYRFVDAAEESRLALCHISTELSQLKFFNVQAIARPGLGSELSFTIYCDQMEFSEFEWGDALYGKVAEHILSRRTERAPYPCYITDIDLSQCQAQLSPELPLQLRHYLSIKALLESKLNRALTEI